MIKRSKESLNEFAPISPPISTVSEETVTRLCGTVQIQKFATTITEYIRLRESTMQIKVALNEIFSKISKFDSFQINIKI